ncbi:MAG: general secretion pathway protein GspB [Pseudomonadota bacterium]
MSYILDALKKNQIEQAPDTPGLRIDSTPTEQPAQMRWQTLAVVVVGILLFLNLAFFGWQAFTASSTTTSASTTPSNSTSTSTPISTSSAINSPTTSPIPKSDQGLGQQESPAEAAAMRQQNAATQQNRSSEVTQTRSESNVDTIPTANIRVIAEPDQDIVIAPAQTDLRFSTPADIERVSVTTLPDTEQVVYNSFEFTSHIYTDDPADCAIVVDGFRLGVGDGFKGLKVVEITSDGVVFAETRRGVERHVEISILDRWAAEG